MSEGRKIKVSSPNTIFDLADWFLAKEPMTNKKTSKIVLLCGSLGMGVIR